MPIILIKIYNTPVSAQPERPFWKSPAILGAMPKRLGEDAYALGVGVAATSIAMEFTTESAIHIRADDNSESAAGETLQRQVHCQASSHNYKPGDTVRNDDSITCARKKPGFFDENAAHEKRRHQKPGFWPPTFVQVI